jgi:5-formyltetrahydrofolate cyclo-ligase
MESIPILKSFIRRDVVKRRDNLNFERWKNLSLVICSKIKQLEEYKKAKKIAFYFAKGKEVNINPLIGEAILEGKEVFLPRTIVSENKLVFHQVFTFGELIPGPFGLLEPPSKNPVIDIEEFEIILVPGIAFDWNKGRIGYGGGYYDRILGITSGKKIGIAFSFQVFKELPLEPHDQRVDLVVTEKEIF